jgi:hypothetical protein
VGFTSSSTLKLPTTIVGTKKVGFKTPISKEKSE